MIGSRDNPRVKRWARLVRDAALRRREGRALVEGPHVVGEMLNAGITPIAILVSASGLERPEIRALAGEAPVVLSERAFAAVADAQTPPGIAAEIDIPRAAARADADRVFLEGVQDPANVGAILRSAAAFGVGAAVLDRACADAWSPKVLRAAMGAHFKLTLQQVPSLLPELASFSGTLLCTQPEGRIALHEASLVGRLGWIFGGEGQGVSEPAAAQAAVRLRIPMMRNTQSINVAAAAAICLHAAYERRLPRQ